MADGKKLTVNDVAQHAGVSPATVSRVQRHPDMVNAATRRRVEESMRELGYQGISGQVMTSGSVQPVVACIPGFDNPFYSEVVRGLRVALEARGLDLLVSWESPDSDEACERYCNLLRGCGASGVVTMGPLPASVVERITAVAPLVQCCEYNEKVSLPYVTIADRDAASTATEHLVSCGCQRIAIVSGPQRFKYSRERLEGFRETLAKHGLECGSGRTLVMPDNSFELAYASICRMLEQDEKPDGIFACSDTYGAAAIRAARRYGLDVPGDLMVVGFDNTSTAVMTTPALTTVSQPRYDMGFTAGTMLLDLMADRQVKSLVLDTELVVRESTTLR